MLNAADLAHLTAGSQTLAGEILQILAASKNPMCCKELFEKSAQASDPMTLSREVYLMTKEGVLEVVKKEKREGFREVQFYRIAPGHSPSNEITEKQSATKTITEIEPSPIVQTGVNEMKKKPSEKSILERLVDLVILNPGMPKEDVKKHFPGGGQPLSDALWRGAKLGRIRREKDDKGIERVYPGKNAVAQPGDQKKSVTVAKPGPVISGKGERIDTKPARASTKKNPIQKTHTAPSSSKQPHPPKGADGNHRFRCARTSDETLLIFGFTPDPIELNVDQVALVVKMAIGDYKQASAVA
jgi:DNA-binding transcriptional regulator GbsR (MarR family)